MESESCIWLSPEDRARLEGWVAGRKTPQKLVWRARIVLMWSKGPALRRSFGRPTRPSEPLIDGGIAICRAASLASNGTLPDRGASPLWRRDDRARRHHDAQRQAAGEHALVAAQDGQGGRP